MKLHRAIIALFAAACLLAGAPSRAATLMPPGEVCFQATTGINGIVGALGTITGGSGGSDGVYGGVALTGGSGAGATANITVLGGVVTGVAILNPGSAYVVGDVLSASIGVTGFSVPVNSISINSSLAGGTVGFYIPSTNTFKQTWQNSAQTILNTNPVNLNQNGCAIIYGEGTYRQILKDSLGNTVWDQLTASTDQGGFYWAGLASGTPNAIAVIDPNFAQIDGQLIQFRAFGTNTGAATLSVSGGPPLPIVKDTATGPTALTGSEIAIGSGGQNNVVSVVFDATNSEFHLIAFPPAAGNTVTEIVPYQGGFKNLTITNGATPSVFASITADQLVLQNAAGSTVKVSSVNCSINITVNTFAANSGGMDLAASQSPVSSWISIWEIYNPTTKLQSCLGSLSATSPFLPAGYTFSARFGWMLTDGSANLMRTAQHGRTGHYVVTTGTNTTQFPSMGAGSTGSALTAIAWAPFAPPTADIITVTLTAVGVNAFTSVAPNNNITGTGFAGYINSVSGTTEVINSPVYLESPDIYWSSGNTGSAINAYSWEDSL